MTESILSRRKALVSTVGVGGALILAGCAGVAQAAPPAPAKPMPPPPAPTPASAPPTAAGAHEVVPLPFSAAKLSGLSEKMITSHHDNNYAGAVKNLNKVELELAKTDKDTAPFVVSGLKSSELTYRNSATLHEHYFGNLGGNGKANAAVEKVLSDTFGSMARWEELFRSSGTALAGGSGWVILGYDLIHGGPRTFASANHREIEAGSAPLLVMDMYEHAYQMDFGSAAAKYIDAFFANIEWDVVEKRLERAKKASAALRA